MDEMKALFAKKLIHRKSKEILSSYSFSSTHYILYDRYMKEMDFLTTKRDAMDIKSVKENNPIYAGLASNISMPAVDYNIKPPFEIISGDKKGGSPARDRVEDQNFKNEKKKSRPSIPRIGLNVGNKLQVTKIVVKECAMDVVNEEIKEVSVEDNGEVRNDS